ncbi:MAG: histidine phosphatase family protein [Ignavibacteria bacterium]|nr:histidine phosphatase family protein [Ignavibacteria bacterium]
MKNRNFLTLIVLLLICILLSPVTCGQINNSEKNGGRTIYLIRHGEYNQADTSDSDLGKELTPLGIAQARLLSARLKSMPIKFTSLFSSTMTRAKQTTQIINDDFPELNIKESNFIRECTPPTWREDIMTKTDHKELTECVDNLEKAFREFFIPSPDASDRNDIIVCHGNVIRYFVTKVLKVDTMAWLQMSISNCSLTIVRILSDGSMKLDAFSDFGHIPENMRTFTGGDNETKELIIPSIK